MMNILGALLSCVILTCVILTDLNVEFHQFRGEELISVGNVNNVNE